MNESNETSSKKTSKTLKTTPAGQRAVDELKKDYGVIADNLCVLTIGQEQLIGEVDAAVYPNLVGEVVCVERPLRYLRIQQVARDPQGNPAGMSIQYMIGDLDMMHGGEALAVPGVGYYIRWLSEESSENYLVMLQQFLRNRTAMEKASKARASGLVLPTDSDVVPFRRQ